MEVVADLGELTWVVEFQRMDIFHDCVEVQAWHLGDQLTVGRVRN
ncbi:hypothetical protein [Streptomyces uncialis]